MKYGKLGVIAGVLLAFCTSLLLQNPMTAYAKDKKRTEAKQEQKQEKKSKWQPELRVGLLSGMSQLNLQVTVPSVLQESDSEKRIVFFSPGKKMEISIEKGKLSVDGKQVNGTKLSLRPQKKEPLTTMQVLVNGKRYPGGVEILLNHGTLTVSNLVAVEDYLRGVLPDEMPCNWPEEALKAQAVAARTFALGRRKHHEDEGYDLCNTTHCQVYGGMASAAESTDTAISATHGEVLTYQGKLIDAFFHTDSGGMTERCSDVWGTEVPYLQAAKELQMNTQPWNVSYSVQDFSAKLAASGRNVGTVKQVKLSHLHVGKGASDRSASGRVKSLEVKGDKGFKLISGNDMRSIFGLRSTLFDIAISKGQVTISGYGWGHGLGMSQWGAKAYASKISYDKILTHYYKNTELKKLY